jgi:hypothetical protein
MENTNNTETFSLIEMVLNEDLAQAKITIIEKLSEKLANAMGERFEEYAPTIFESSHKKTKKKKDNGKRWQDSDGDGKWYEPGDDVKAVNEETYCEDGDCEGMEDSEDVEEGEEQYEKEEKGESKKESGKKSKKNEEEEKEEDEE